MSATSGDNRLSQLRLASARRRLSAFLDQIDDLRAANFPHPDGKQALDEIHENVSIRMRSLDLPANVEPDVVDGVCTQIGLVVQRYTTVLGFILRSTNVRNAFELHYPLKRLVEQAIGPDAKLLLSSEWDFVPFTYPKLDLLPNYVLIGAPAVESSNVLLTPLAGHEIGHSAWRQHNLKAELETELAVAISAVLEGDAEGTTKLLEDFARMRMNRADLQHRCLNLGLMQLEEIFCDLFGLYVFGPAYLFAFEYFLAPGGGTRDPYYPSEVDRIGFLTEAAEELAFSPEPGLFERWKESSLVESVPGVMKVVDLAVARLVPALRKRGFDLLRDCGVSPPDKIVVERVKRALRRREPDAEGASLAEIVTAGWLYVREEVGLASPEQQDEYRMLCELMLKSIEVSEYRQRVAENA